VEELIKRLRSNFKHLSKGQKQVAKLLFDDPSVITFSPAFEVGKMVNVSESTVIRLSQTLGYKGFAELQEIIRQSTPQGRILTQHQEVSNIQKGNSLFSDLMRGDLNNIQNLMDSLEESTIQEAAKMIGHAERIYIIGSMSTYGLAHFFSQWLNMLLGNAELLVPDSTEYYTQLSKVNGNSLVIPITFPRYMKSTVKTVDMVKKKGACIFSNQLLLLPIQLQVL